VNARLLPKAALAFSAIPCGLVVLSGRQADALADVGGPIALQPQVAKVRPGVGDDVAAVALVDRDAEATAGVVQVARAQTHGGQLLGRQLSPAGDLARAEVIGVVGESSQNEIERKRAPAVHLVGERAVQVAHAAQRIGDGLADRRRAPGGRVLGPLDRPLEAAAHEPDRLVRRGEVPPGRHRRVVAIGFDPAEPLRGVPLGALGVLDRFLGLGRIALGRLELLGVLLQVVRGPPEPGLGMPQRLRHLARLVAEGVGGVAPPLVIVLGAEEPGHVDARVPQGVPSTLQFPSEIVEHAGVAGDRIAFRHRRRFVTSGVGHRQFRQAPRSAST
jgi:hypothetical protein